MDNKSGDTLENVATPAACQRVISCVHKTVEAVDEEREILAVPRGCHFGHRHNTDTMTLHAQHRQLIFNIYSQRQLGKISQ